LPQDDRRVAHLTYDDGTDPVATLNDHWGRDWRLEAPKRNEDTSTSLARSPSWSGPRPPLCRDFTPVLVLAVGSTALSYLPPLLN
jgi:hypothetical protein